MAIFIESALIVSYSEKSVEFFSEMLKAVSCRKIVTVPTSGEARRMLLERSFDYCIINAPLRDESGEGLSRYIASKGTCQVILVVKAEVYDELSALVEDLGVITISKPINRGLFWSALKLAKAVHKNMRLMQSENSRLVQKIEDIRIIDRAKCILISNMGMSEQEAHKYIEKNAMDMRMTKRAVAEGILRTYEN